MLPACVLVRMIFTVVLYLDLPWLWSSSIGLELRVPHVVRVGRRMVLALPTRDTVSAFNNNSNSPVQKLDGKVDEFGTQDANYA